MITVPTLLRKLRRGIATTLAVEYVQQAIKTRTGACDRCGACCKIGFRCPAYREESGCSIYNDRPPACRAFPIAPSDLLDVERCSYSFSEPSP